MIKKIASIQNLAVFKNFDWDKEIRFPDGGIGRFEAINVIYGRNYSGKTTLSRIVRAMETGVLSDKYLSPSFCVSFSDEVQVTQGDLVGHGKKIRVFNEDFVRENIRFITNPDDSIEPFAILGEDNNKIEQEIKALENELGSNEEGKETALYAKLIEARKEYSKAKEDHKKSKDALEKQLSDKATDRSIGIKYKAGRFGDQNYNIQKLRADIETVLKDSYQPPEEEQLAKHEKLITEKTLQSVSAFRAPSLQFKGFADEAEVLIAKKISESDKIEELVKDAVLNRWVKDGRTHHKGKRDNCAFCGSAITMDRWKKLEKHFDEESGKLEKDIDSLIQRIENEKNLVSSALSVNNSLFYSGFHDRLNSLTALLKNSSVSYAKSLDALISQLKTRKDNLLSPTALQRPDDVSVDLMNAWSSYEVIRSESEEFTKSLSGKQSEAREALRLCEVSKYLVTIGYQSQRTDIENKKIRLDATEQNGKKISGEIAQKEALIAEKKRELNDEEKGAKKVNEYLKGFFGHRFLSLEARKGDDLGDGPKKIRFEVIRDGEKAYHLSEGECRLLAFCYFLAKLDDTDTKGSRPIIWIDDPISSLDSNHVFFVYSLINSEIVSVGKFEQLFLSTHNLDFLKYLKRLNSKYIDADGKQKKGYQRAFFIVVRQDKISTIGLMPKYLKEYVTEFNYLFHQIYKCASIEAIDDTNYTTFYNFGNNARKFFEIYLYYKYPDHTDPEEKLRLFFGDERIPAVLTDRINNEYSHLSGVFERGSTPVEVPEMQTSARQIIESLKKDKEQYSALLKSIGVEGVQ